MSEAQKLVIKPEVAFTDQSARVAYHTDNLITLAKMKFPSQPLTVEMVLSCRKHETGEDPVLSESIGIKLKALETAKETNEKGVSMEEITNFVSGLKLKFGVAKEKVLERLQTSLSPEKLNNLMYFQTNGHELDVTGVDSSTGELEFDTCSIESPQGEHRNKNYFQSLELATQNGATLMSTDKYKWFRTQGTILDPRTWSWINSPDAGTPEKPGRAFGGYGGVVGGDYDPNSHAYDGAFRVSLRV